MSRCEEREEVKKEARDMWLDSLQSGRSEKNWANKLLKWATVTDEDIFSYDEYYRIGNADEKKCRSLSDVNESNNFNFNYYYIDESSDSVENPSFLFYPEPRDSSEHSSSLSENRDETSSIFDPDEFLKKLEHRWEKTEVLILDKRFDNDTSAEEMARHQTIQAWEEQIFPFCFYDNPGLESDDTKSIDKNTIAQRRNPGEDLSHISNSCINSTPCTESLLNDNYKIQILNSPLKMADNINNVGLGSESVASSNLCSKSGKRRRSSRRLSRQSPDQDLSRERRKSTRNLNLSPDQDLSRERRKSSSKKSENSKKTPNTRLSKSNINSTHTTSNCKVNKANLPFSDQFTTYQALESQLLLGYYRPKNNYDNLQISLLEQERNLRNAVEGGGKVSSERGKFPKKPPMPQTFLASPKRAQSLLPSKDEPMASFKILESLTPLHTLESLAKQIFRWLPRNAIGERLKDERLNLKGSPLSFSEAFRAFKGRKILHDRGYPNLPNLTLLKDLAMTELMRVERIHAVKAQAEAERIRDENQKARASEKKREAKHHAIDAKKPNLNSSLEINSLGMSNQHGNNIGGPNLKRHGKKGGAHHGKTHSTGGKGTTTVSGKGKHTIHAIGHRSGVNKGPGKNG